MNRSIGVAVLLAWSVVAGSAWADKETTLSKVSYDAEKKALTVVFEKGGTYEYAGVPQATYDELQKAESKGTYFNQNVRGKYAAKKIAD